MHIYLQNPPTSEEPHAILTWILVRWQEDPNGPAICLLKSDFALGYEVEDTLSKQVDFLLPRMGNMLVAFQEQENDPDLVFDIALVTYTFNVEDDAYGHLVILLDDFLRYARGASDEDGEKAAYSLLQIIHKTIPAPLTFLQAPNVSTGFSDPRMIVQALTQGSLWGRGKHCGKPDDL